MSAIFKIKPDKPLLDDNRITLNFKHQQMLKYFRNYGTDIFELHRQLADFNKKREKLFADLDVDPDSIKEMDDKIIKLKENIEELKKNENENQYFVDVLRIYSHYSDQIKSGEKHKIRSKQTKMSKYGVVKYVDADSNMNKDILNEILRKYGNNTKDNKAVLVYDDYHTQCKHCNQVKTIVNSDGKAICTNCAVEEKVVIDNGRPTYKESKENKETNCQFKYKKINHFNEWMNQLQGKESTYIPEYVYTRLKDQIAKDGIKDYKTLTNGQTRDYLKKLKLSKYYEHIPYILNHIGGPSPPVLSAQTEERLRNMFRDILEPFNKYCPDDRSNFLNYAYVFHKFFELLEMDNMLDFCPLLKSRQKREQMDSIFEKICHDLNWCFYPST
jgi:hypothetical protein